MPDPYKILPLSHLGTVPLVTSCHHSNTFDSEKDEDQEVDSLEVVNMMQLNSRK
jgi:hypothetical protein